MAVSIIQDFFQDFVCLELGAAFKKKKKKNFNNLILEPYIYGLVKTNIYSHIWPLFRPFFKLCQHTRAASVPICGIPFCPEGGSSERCALHEWKRNVC